MEIKRRAEGLKKAFSGLQFFEPEGLTYPAGHGIIILSTTDTRFYYRNHRRKVPADFFGLEISYR